MQKPKGPADEGESDESHEVVGELVIAGGEVPVLLEPGGVAPVRRSAAVLLPCHRASGP